MTTENRDILSDLSFDEAARSHVRAAATWARIVAIVAFISYAINLLVAFAGTTPQLEEASSAFGGSASRTSQIAGTLITVIIGVIINLFLLRFANNAKEAVDKLSQGSLENGFNALSVYFKILGILLIIAMVFVVLAMLLVGSYYNSAQ
jgi:hypothetical protein